jgi:hypothetical protein
MSVHAGSASHVLADSTSYVDWASMGKILLISIAAGAGLVTIYALGLLALSASGYLRGNTDDTAAAPAHAAPDAAVSHRHNILALLAAVLCAAVVVAAAVYGIHVMLAKG